MMTSSNGNIFGVIGPLCSEFPSQIPVTWNVFVFFYLCLNKRLSKQSLGWCFDVPSYITDVFDIDGKHWCHDRFVSDVIKVHAPLKVREPVKRPVPYVNAINRMTCHKKAINQNTCYKYGHNKLSLEYITIRRGWCFKNQSKTYSQKRCSGNTH